jgi:predicted CoA-substrate-specific enzyme activase
MIQVGIDLGSRTAKIVVMEDDKIVREKVIRNTFDHAETTAQLLSGLEYDQLTATGYGRHFFDNKPNCSIISEIKAFSLGVNSLYPKARTILDIGGQDTKVISLDARGKMKKFIMNDKCAAGTGRFLEIMANALNYEMPEFGKAALNADQSEKINNMCTVFAESEVISLLSKGCAREHVALGIHKSIASRAVGQLQKLGWQDQLIFVGGVAYNPAVRKIISQSTGLQVFTPQNPQIIGALGAVLYAKKQATDTA